MNLNEKFRLNGGTSVSFVTGDCAYAYDGWDQIIWRMAKILINNHPRKSNYIIKMDLVRVNELNETIPDFVPEDSENWL